VLFQAETEEDLEKIAKTGGKEMAEAVEEMRYLAGSPEFLHIETVREIARLDEGQKLSNAEERGEKRGITIGEQKIIDLLRQGVSPDDIVQRYGQRN